MAHLPALNGWRRQATALCAGFPEQFEPAFAQSKQVRLLNLERDAGAFAEPLPNRFSPIKGDDYDPLSAFGDLLVRG